MARKATVRASRASAAASRYQRVKAILDAAAGDSTSDYGGAGTFWDKGVEKLAAARIYGVAHHEAPAEPLQIHLTRRQRRDRFVFIPT